MPRGLTPLSWLRRQSAQRRLQAGFGLLIALLLAVAGLAALRFNEYRSTVDAYADGSMQRIRLAAELSAWLAPQIAKIKLPRRIDFDAELPRHPTGKLYKRKLRDRYWPAKDAR